MTLLNQNNIKYLVGGDIKSSNLEFEVFDEYIIDFFDELSKELMNDINAKKYPDIVTFAFYVRKANVKNLKNKYCIEFENVKKLGRGIVFHIAPSNVPVNFAYSLFSSLICGNKNIVKVSSKEFEQVDILCKTINDVLVRYQKLSDYINIVKYNNEKEITDYFSSVCDVRVIWGGDNTINLIKDSPTKPRAREVLFADRYSLLVVDSNYYKTLSQEEKNKIAHSVYNDTYLSDQNACTSPRLICFIGDKSVNEEFYTYLQNEVASKYDFKPIFSTNKLLDASKFLIDYSDLNPKLVLNEACNYIVRLVIDKLDDKIVNFAGNTGLFVECNIRNLSELVGVCNHDSVQTISYVGEKRMFDELINLKTSGVDRIVPVGKTMDFNLIWDGYNLFEMLTRNIEVL